MADIAPRRSTAFFKEKGKNLRILVLDAGELLLTQHEQNYPNINPNTGPFNVVTSNLNEPVRPYSLASVPPIRP
jgi:hypothetical protein